MKFFPTLLTCSLIFGAELQGATYVAPVEEGKILVHTDQLPLDTDTLQWMSDYLAKLAAKQAKQDAIKLQSAAKLIALANQLSPNNAEVEKAAKALSNGTPGTPNPQKDKKHAEKFESILSYLEKDSESNKSSKQFLSLTDDALNAIKSVAYFPSDKNQEADLWQGSIAALSDFEKEPELPEVEKVVETKPTEEAAPKEKIDAIEWQKTEQSIHVLANVNSRNEAGRVVIHAGLQPFKVKITPSENVGRITLKTHHLTNGTDYLSTQGRLIEQALKAEWGTFRSAQVTADFGKPYSERNDYIQSATAITVALDSALHNQDIRKNLAVIALINSSGQFRRSPDFWNKMNKLTRFSNNKRLLVATDSEGDLRQLLAYEKVDFFATNEVIAVKNLQQARLYSATDKDSEIKEATKLFEEVQTALKNKSLRSMTSNKFVREKLTKVLEIVPGHISAKMLLLYGEPKRVTKLERKYLAFELTNIIKPASYYQRIRNALSTNYNHSLRMSEKMDKQLRELKVFAYEADLGMLEALSELSDEIDDFGKYTEKARHDDGTVSSYHLKSANDSLKKVKAQYNSIMLNLSKETGIPYQAPQ